LYFGLSGNAANEIASAAQFCFPNSVAIEHANSFVSVSQQPSDGSKCQIANVIFLASGPELTASFTRQWLASNRAEFGVIRFSGITDLCSKANSWVKQATSGWIQTLIEPHGIPNETVMLIANATCFKGLWETPFPATATYIGTFSVAPGETYPSKFMSLAKKLRYFRDQNFHVIEIPYEAKRYAMYVALPQQGHSLNELEDNLSLLLPTILGFNNFPKVDVIAEIPKFKFRVEYDLSPELMSIGIKEVFSGAEFSGILNGPGKPISLSQIRHTVIIDVDETGTKAAAATAIGVIPTSGGGEAPPPILFKADHPFLFFIVDRVCGTILFLGRVKKPSE